MHALWKVGGERGVGGSCEGGGCCVQLEPRVTNDWIRSEQSREQRVSLGETGKVSENVRPQVSSRCRWSCNGPHAPRRLQNTERSAHCLGVGWLHVPLTTSSTGILSCPCGQRTHLSPATLPCAKEWNYNLRCVWCWSIGEDHALAITIIYANVQTPVAAHAGASRITCFPTQTRMC